MNQINGENPNKSIFIWWEKPNKKTHTKHKHKHMCYINEKWKKSYVIFIIKSIP